MLCWVLVERARHEHMSDEYKDRYIIAVLLEPLSWVNQSNTRPPQFVPSELIKGAQVNKLTNTDLPTCIVGRLLKRSCILLVRIFY